MTTISATVVADSIANGIRLTTLALRYPRFIHAEFMTHRHFSRNASSSRAIPVERLIADISRDPVVPLYWGKNQKGMQAGEELTGEALESAEHEWRQASGAAVDYAKMLVDVGLHKQVVNRLLEPFSHINVVVTATEWSNFFALRAHPDAEPHIQLLARKIGNAMALSVPKELQHNEWHLPFVMSHEVHTLGSYGAAIPLSVARCARVSYMTHDGRQPKLEEDLQLAQRLLGAVPLHASPAEHQAKPDQWRKLPNYEGWEHPELHGNLRGWIQYRKTLPGECQ